MEPHSEEHKILFSFGVLILIILTLLGNISVCLAVAQCQYLQRDVNYLILSLAVADILTALVSMPIWLHFEITAFSNMTSRDVHMMSNVWFFFDMLCGVASIANLTSIAYERMWSVYSPLQHRRYFNKFLVIGIICGTWTYAIIVAVCSLKFHGTFPSTIYITTFGYFIPLVLICIALLRIYIIVKRSPRTMITPKENCAITRSICIVVGAFVMCWAPLTIASILSHTCCYDYMIEHLWMRSLFKFLSYANSCINPIIYGIANVQYKDAFRQVMRKVYLKIRRKSSPGVGQGSQMCPFPKLNIHAKENDENASYTSDSVRKSLRSEVSETKEDFGTIVKSKESEKEVSVSTQSTSLSPLSIKSTDITENKENIEIDVTSMALKEFPGVDIDYDAEQSECFIHSKPLSQVKRSTSLINMFTGNSIMDDPSALQQALLNPEHLKRTSCL